MANNTNAALPLDTPETIDVGELNQAILTSNTKIQPNWLDRQPDHVIRPRRRLWGGWQPPRGDQGVDPNQATYDPATGRVVANHPGALIQPETGQETGSGIPVGTPLPATMTMQPNIYPSPTGAQAFSVEQLETMLAQAKDAQAADAAAASIQSNAAKEELAQAKADLTAAKTEAKNAKTDQEKADAARAVDLAQQAVDRAQANVDGNK